MVNINKQNLNGYTIMVFAIMKTLKYYLILSVSLVFVSCVSGPGKTIEASWPTLQEVESLLGQRIDRLPDFGVFTLNDTMMESEGVEWPAVRFSSEGKTIMLAEANWENEDVVQRITILDGRIKCADIYAGQQFGKIRDALDTSRVSGPDGYLFFKANSCQNLAVSFDLSHEPYGSALFFGQVPFGLIPDSLLVDALIMRK